MSLSVEINSTVLDLSPGESIIFSKKGARIGEISTRQGSLTNDFTIPLSQKNIEALGFTNRTDFTSRLVYEKQEAKLSTNDGFIVSYGYVQIISFNLTANTASITFFGDFSGFSSLLEGKSIRDIDLNEYNHRYTESAIVNSFSNEDGYIYPPIDYGNFSNYATLPNTLVTDWFPATFQHTIVKKIAEEAGYKVSGPLLDEWEYRRTIIPFSNENYQVSEDYARNFAGSLGSTNYLYSYIPSNVTGIGSSTSTFLFQSASQDSFNSFDLPTNSWICPESNTYKGIFTVDIVSPSSVVISGDASVTVRIEVLKNGTEVLLNETILTGDTLGTNTITPRTTSYEIDSGFNTNDTLSARIVYEYNAVTTTNLVYAIHTENTSLEISSIDRQISEGDNVTLSSILPDISQEEFLQDVFQRYAVLPYVDETSKTLFLYPFEYITNRLDKAEDWSSKLVHNRPKRVIFTDLVSSYAQKNYFNYQENEEDDSLLEDYRRENLEIFGKGTLSISNEFLEGEQDEYTSPFSPTIHRDVFGDTSYLPYIPRYQTGETDVLETNPRILICTAPVSMATGTTKGYFGNTTSINIGSTNVSSVPYAFFQNKKQGFDSDNIQESLSWDIPNLTNATGKGILERRYRTLNRILNTPRLVELTVKLFPHEVNKQDFLTPVFLNTNGIQGYFLIDEIDSYDGRNLAVVRLTEIPGAIDIIDDGDIKSAFATPGDIIDLSGVISSTQVVLTWSVPSGVPTQYEVYYKESSAQTYILWNTVGVNSETVTGLTDGTQYDFKVVPKNSNGPGNDSNIFQATPADIPGSIADLAATVGNGQITLNWTDPNNNGSALTGREVEFKETTGGTYALFESASSNTSTVTGLTNGTSYTFRVRGVNAAGNGPYSNEVVAIPATIPGQISDVSITPGDSQLEITWSDPADTGGEAPTSFDLLVDGTTTTLGVTSPYTLSGLVNDQNYTIQIRAVNTQGNGPYSNAITGTPAGASASWGLVVPDTTTPNAWEATLKAAIEAKGHTATYVDDATTDYTTNDIYYISPNTATGDLDSASIIASDKVIVLANRSYADNIEIAGSSPGGQTDIDAITILDAASSLAGGLSGTVTLNSSNYGVQFLNTSSAVASMNAVAEPDNSSTRIVIGNIETGELLDDGSNAIGPRIFWGLIGDAGGGDDTNFDTLQDALIDFAVSEAGITGGGGNTGLPSPWKQNTIGSQGTGPEIGWTYDQDTDSFNGTDFGSGIIGTEDGFIYLYQEFSSQSDFTVDVRVNSLSGVDAFAKVGPMIRQDLSSDSKMFFAGQVLAEEPRINARTTDGGSAPSEAYDLRPPNPVYMRLRKIGSSYSGFISTDGITFNQIGSASNISMSGNFFVGIALTANTIVDGEALSNVDNISITESPGVVTPPPTGGGYVLSGTQTYTPAVPSIYAQGSDIDIHYSPGDNIMTWEVTDLDGNIDNPTTGSVPWVFDQLEANSNTNTLHFVLCKVGGEVNLTNGSFLRARDWRRVVWIGHSAKTPIVLHGRETRFVNCTDCLIMHMTFMNTENSSDTLGFNGCTKMVLKNCSATRGSDECVSSYSDDNSAILLINFMIFKVDASTTRTSKGGLQNSQSNSSNRVFTVINFFSELTEERNFFWRKRAFVLHSVVANYGTKAIDVSVPTTGGSNYSGNYHFVKGVYVRRNAYIRGQKSAGRNNAPVYCQSEINSGSPVWVKNLYNHEESDRDDLENVRTGSGNQETGSGTVLRDTNIAENTYINTHFDKTDISILNEWVGDDIPINVIPRAGCFAGRSTEWAYQLDSKQNWNNDGATRYFIGTRYSGLNSAFAYSKPSMPADSSGYEVEPPSGWDTGTSVHDKGANDFSEFELWYHFTIESASVLELTS